MTLRRIRWLAFLGLALLVGLLEVTRRALGPYFPSLAGHLLLDGVVVGGAVFFFGALFHVVNRMQAELERRNRELLALHEAGLDIHSNLSTDEVLQRVVDQARALVGARYGALSVIDQDRRIEAFLTSGLSPEERAAIGPPPTGQGLLGISLHEGQHLRLADLGRDPRAHGFPANHPPMKSLLAVPIVCKGPFRGNLYLTERAGGSEFTAGEEDTLARLATKAAIAIDNAYLHQRLRSLAVAEERLRIAHEMHDGMAQVLAYVNTKAQAVQAYLRAGKGDEADAQLDQLAKAAREVYADAREGILGLRTASGPSATLAVALRAFLTTWRDQSGIEVELEADDSLRFEPAVELQLLRIVQESLTNVRKHARASCARVELLSRNGKVAVRIEDDGVGFDLGGGPRRSEFPRFGLTTMRERAESVGGVLEVDTAPGGGTRIRVEIPAHVVGVERERNPPHAHPDR
jgi:signal transduction histidine kinase